MVCSTRLFVVLFMLVVVTGPSNAWLTSRFRRDANPGEVEDTAHATHGEVKEIVEETHQGDQPNAKQEEADEKLLTHDSLEAKHPGEEDKKIIEDQKSVGLKIKLRYEPKKDSSEVKKDYNLEDDLLKKLSELFKMDLTYIKEEEQGKLKDRDADEVSALRKLWETFLRGDGGKIFGKEGPAAKEEGKLESALNAGKESRHKDVELKIEEDEHALATKSLFDLEESVFDHKIDSEKVKYSGVVPKRVQSGVVYADEDEEIKHGIADDEKLKEGRVHSAGFGPKADEDHKGTFGKDLEASKKAHDAGIGKEHKLFEDEVSEEHVADGKHLKDTAKKHRGAKADEEKIHTDGAKAAADGNRPVPPRGFLPQLPTSGSGSDDSLEDSSEEDSEDSYNDDNIYRWLRSGTNGGVPQVSRIPLFFDSSLNLNVPLRIPLSTYLPSFGDSQGREQTDARLTNADVLKLDEEKEEEKEFKAVESPYFFESPLARQFLLYPWVTFEEFTKKIKDFMKQLNLKAAHEEVKGGILPVEFKNEVVEIEGKKFLLITRKIKDPEGKRKAYVGLVALRPIAEIEAKKLKELEEEKKVIDELLARKKELHELWLKKTGIKKASLKKDGKNEKVTKLSAEQLLSLSE